MKTHKSIPLLTAILLIFTVPSGLAGHTDDDRDVTFDHKTGNEWWVEVVLGGVDAASVTGVDAQDTDGDWIALEKKSWGAWAASFHIEPGHLVQFRAHVDGEAMESCWFSHPEGQRLCSADWQATTLRSGGYGLGLTMDNVDDDASVELIETSEHSFLIYEHRQQGWMVEESLSDGVSVSVDAGDADQDGQPDLASTFQPGPRDRVGVSGVVIQEAQDGEWVTTFSGTFGGDLGQITIGDIEEDGTQEVYVAAGDDLLVLRPDGDTYTASQYPLGVDAYFVWIGDADNDGDRELLFAASWDDGLYVADFDASGQLVVTQIAASTGRGSAGVAIGDADGDGLNEAYLLRGEPTTLYQATFDGAWSGRDVATYDGRQEALFLGDTDGDGRAEVYAATSHGAHGAISESQDEGGWQTALLHTYEADLGQALIVGDGDGDGQGEVYFNTARPGMLVELHRTGDTGEAAPTAATFDSRNGNEWWVQVRVTDADPTRVQAKDTGDPWKELELKDWGDWARSFHVEPGNDVRFRAMVDGEWLVSCWFTHPAGKAPDGGETCTAGTPTPSDFDASFDTPGGNEWWVEVYVDGNEPLAGVEARDDGGQWVALEKKDWGAWAKSFHVEDGSIVEFRATSTDGDRDISQGYWWPSGDPA